MSINNCTEADRNIMSLKGMIKEQQDKTDINEVQELQQKFFQKYVQPPRKSLTFSEINKAKLFSSREQMQLIYMKIKEQRSNSSKILKQIVPLETLLSICSIAEQFFETLPNVECVDIPLLEEHFHDDGTCEVHKQGQLTFLKPKELQVPDMRNNQLIIVGDTHGTFDVIEHLFETYGHPEDASSPIYVFNGDYVDRGSNSVCTFLYLVSLKISYPTRIFLTRGNHECRSVCSAYSLLAECYHKYPIDLAKVFNAITAVFVHLPLGIRVADKLLVVHGGINTGSLWMTDVLEKLNRHREPEQVMSLSLSDPLCDVLWSDPSPNEECEFNAQRMTSCLYGANGLQRYLQLNGLEALIRSHEVCPNGLERHHQGRTWTLFSVPNYADGNLGAVLLVNKYVEGVTLKFSQFTLDQAASMDAQVFGDPEVQSEFCNPTPEAMERLKDEPERTILFFTFLSMGLTVADVGAPLTFKSIQSKEGVIVSTSDDLRTKIGAEILMQRMIDFAQENELDVLSIAGLFDIETQADMIMVAGKTLKEWKVDVPVGLIWSNIGTTDLEKIVEEATKETHKEQRRIQKLNEKKAIRQAQIAKAGKKGRNQGLKQKDRK